MTLAERLANAKQLIKQAAEDAATLVKAGPDNPNIKRLSGRSFVMSQRHLGSNWTPGHHDWKFQYEVIADMLDKQQFSALNEVLRTGREKKSGSLRFAPEVLDRVREIIGEDLMS